MSSATIQLSSYQIAEKIYEGSRTLVYRGTRNADEKPVIIKILRHEYPSFSELVQFGNQYAIAHNLDLPGIVKPLALEPHRNGYALIMPDQGYVSLQHWDGEMGRQGDGETKRQFSTAEFLNIAIQLAEILHGLYQHRVIHKDIKPANILIHPQTKRVKLIDFSIASLLPKEAPEIKNPNVLEGTLTYISPEQTGRMNRGVDYRSDFYSLGVTFYELLSGKLPFEADDPMELVHCHIAQSPPPLTNQTEIPKVLSAIAMKLMAKNAEDRYQSALGLKHDLEKCQQQWEATGNIERFLLAEQDRCDRFLLPEKLYGREPEVAKLLAAFERVTTGDVEINQTLSPNKGLTPSHSELMLVAGYSGVGKTAIVNAVHKPIVKQRGYFISGKFDQFNRNIPFSAFVQAFRNLIGQLLGESETNLATWKTKILEAVGESGQIIIEVIPELERILGEQPPVSELSGSAAQNRFNLLFGKFVRVFAAQDHPLVIFLDDLQWADSASLNLLKLLMGDTETGYLLVLGAYRDNEVFPAHPLMLTLDEIQKQGANLNTLTLEPLSALNINDLVADTLLCEREVARPLSQLVYQKTQGNPFFTTQFLRGLHEEGCIVFDSEAGYWQCDLTRVRQLALTDDVVAFMVGRLQRFPERTQKVLKLGACIGNRFDLATLAIVCEESQEEVAGELWAALQEGLVIPESETYKFFQRGDREVEAMQDIAVNYRFLHDRVQQAAYSLIPQAQKSATHYKLGQLLFEEVAPEEQDERVFEIVNNLNHGIEFIEDKQKKIQTATLNLRAARKAKKSIAYSVAVNYLNMGIHLLGEENWENEYSLMFDLYKECAEAEYLKGDLERSEVLANRSLARARSAIEKAEIYNILIVQYTVTAQYQNAINIGKIALDLLKIQWHEEKLSQDLEKELEFTKSQLSNREIASLIDLPEMEIPEKRSAIEILHNLLPATFSVNQSLWSVLVVKIVNLSLQYGHISECCFGYSFYGVLVSSIFGDYKSGYEFGILSLNLSRKFKDLAQESKACNILAAFLLHWQKPISHCEKINDRGYETGLESGQLQFIGYIIYNRILSLFHSGKNLDELLKNFPIYLPILEKIQHYYSYDIMIGCQLAILSLTSPRSLKLSEPIQYTEESEYLKVCRKRDSFPGICIYQILKAQTLYLFDRAQTALEYLSSAKKFINFINGHFTVAEYNYYHSLALLVSYRSASSQEQAEILEQVKENQEQLNVWAKNCPENFQHKVNLVKAETARNCQEKLVAIEMYDRAISGAKENSFIQDEALANELAAKFYLNWGKEKVAAGYMQEAYYCYSRWGTKAKTDHLEQTYPQLLTPILQQQQQSLFDPNATLTWNSAQTVTSHSSTTISSTLDFTTVFRVAQAISEEIHLDRLLSTLMQVAIKNAGADKGVLILSESGSYVVQAIKTFNTSSEGGQTAEVSTLLSRPLEESHEIPRSLIRYVARTAELVVVHDVAADRSWARDDYFATELPKSLLCTPIMRQGRVVGILYLENQKTKGAFTRDRVEVLNLLTAQAAISLENAQLYQKSQAYAQQAQDYAQQLKHSLEDLQNTQLQLVQSEKMSALGNLVAGVAHEINNPVGFIAGNLQPAREYISDLLGLIDLLLEQLPNMDEEVEEEIEAVDLEFVREDLPKLLSSMAVGVERIRNISKGLRIFSRTDKDYKVAFNLHDGLESTLLILKHRLKANEQRPAIEVVKEYGELPEIQCFPGQLNQVFMNLIANAIDALEESSEGKSFQEIEGHPNCLIVQTQQERENVVISIRDNGKGMSEDLKNKIFEQGFTTKGVGKGTGLGLAIARQIVEEKHGGSLAVQSKMSQGTEFCIRLPILG